MKRSNPVDKGKEKINKSSDQMKMQPYKAAIAKTPEQLKTEIMGNTPTELKLREDAYKLAVKSNQIHEFLYPYISLSTEWITAIEKKYSHLTPSEICSFYLKDYADPFHYPKNFQYYFHILESTGSVQFDSVTRSGNEYAYSKAFIKRVITPQEWNGDLYNFRETLKDKKNNPKPFFNYFDYMKAWSGAFCYENRKEKHSWFIQFRDFEAINLPQWFIQWFFNWGLNPIILPDKIRTVFENFSQINESMKFKELMFAALYQVPWILRWDIIIRDVPITKFGVTQGTIPYMGRRILIKWWDKFKFFEESVFEKK